MSIKQALAEQKVRVQARLGEKFNVITGEVERIRGLGFLDRSLKAGQAAPGFALPDAYGREVSLKTLLAKGPVVVSFYRGEWCPYCNIELHGLQEALPKIREFGATLIAISPEKPDHGIVATEKNKLTFPVLSDFGNKVADFDNCPDSVTVFCEDENGVAYRYVRTRGGDIEVKAKEDRSVVDVPIDAFHVEYFGQGELGKVAEDPLKHPELFQQFLDRHTSLRDLVETEQTLVTSLRENAGRLNPLETAFSQLAAKKQSLLEIEKKLKIAEEGNLREVVGKQSKLASEKAIRESVETIVADYTRGFNLASIQRNFDQIVATSGECTDDDASVKTIAAIKQVISESNALVKQKEVELNALVRACATELTRLTGELKVSHQRMSGEIALKLADLKARGLATDIPGLEALLRQKTAVAREIAVVEQRTNERQECRDQRVQLRADLQKIREDMTARRKAQLAADSMRV